MAHSRVAWLTIVSPGRYGRARKLREVVRDDVAENSGVDAEVLVDEDVSKSSNLRPWDLGDRFRELRWELAGRLANDLQIALYGVGCHLLNEGVAAIDYFCVLLASADGVEDVGDPLLSATAQNGTASRMAVLEISSLSNCGGKMSMSFRLNRFRVSSIRPEARSNTFPSAGSISTKMSMSLPS